MSESIKRRILLVYPHVFPALLLMALEIQNAPQILRNPVVFVINCALIYLPLLILIAATGRVFPSALTVSLLLLVFYTVSFYRHTQTGQVLIPIDLNFTRHIKSLAAFSNLSFSWRTVVSIICAGIINIPMFFVSGRIRPGYRKRGLVFGIAAPVMTLFFFMPFSSRILPALNFKDAAEMTYNELYKNRGALFGFYTVAMAGEVGEPSAYGLPYMERLADRVRRDAKAPVKGYGFKPDVIVVMSEAFWDPTKLPNVEYSQDPVPNYHRLRELMTDGNLVTPVFGGLTGNTEYEFLTGNAMKYAAYGQVPYFKGDVYVDTDEGRSLPSMFRKNGYRTMALHTYTGVFYDRLLHYPKLGFDGFTAAEDLDNPLIKGTFHGQEIIADEYFCDKLLRTIDGAALENPDEPLFMFGITMQNHTPYLADKYEETRIKADSGGLLTEEDKLALESYLEGVSDADAVLGRLYDYVQNTERPTVLVYFGDHLPFITQSTGVYAELGYIDALNLDELTLDEHYRMYTTPYLACSNFSELPDTWGDISPYFLGALTADAAGISKNLYYTFLTEAFDSFQAMNDNIYIANGQLFSDPPPYNMTMTMFESFQYDKLFGEGYMNRVMAALQK